MATAGTPAEVVGLVVQAVEGVGALGRQLVSVKTEVIKLMNAPSSLEEVEQLRGEFEEVKIGVAILAEHRAYTEGGVRAWREFKGVPGSQGGGSDSPGGSGRLGKDPGRAHRP